MIDKYVEHSPLDELQEEEYHNLILDFCTLVCMIENKKMNFPSIFVTVISNEELTQLCVDFCGFSDKRDALREFLKIDESIVKSKYLKRVIKNN